MNKRILSIIFLFVCIASSCSVLEPIAKYNLDTLDEMNTSQKEVLQSLPESTYIKNNVELFAVDTKTLNPLDSVEYTIDQVLKVVYEPLFSIESNYQLEPVLAMSYEKTQEQVYQIELAQHFFHDQTAVTAADVLFSYQYIVNQPLSSYSYVSRYIESITILSDYKLEVKFKKIDWFNLYALTFPIVSKAYLESENYDPLYPIGSGMYRFEDFQAMQKMSFVRSETSDVRPTIDRIDVTFVRKEEDAKLMFDSKRIDIYAPKDIIWEEYSDDNTVQTLAYTSPYFYYIGINHSDELLKNIAFRKLLASLIPYETIRKDVFLNHMILTQLPIFPDFDIVSQLDPYYVRLEEGSYYQSKYNEETVQEQKSNLMNFGMQIGSHSPIPLDIIYIDQNKTHEKIVALLQTGFAEQGITLNPIALNASDYQTKLTTGEFDLYVGKIKTGITPDITSLFHSTGQYNFGKFNDINVDGLLSSYRSVSTSEQMINQLQNLSKVFTNDLPIFPLGFSENALFIHDQVHGSLSPNFYHVLSDFDVLY